MFDQRFSVILLAGGAGTRIRHLHPDVPKPLIEVAERPFLDWVFRYWINQGATRAVIAAGYLGHVMESYIADAKERFPELSLEVLLEPEPFGTGGAAVWAARQAPSLLDYPVAVANADSLVLADLSAARSAVERDGAAAALLGLQVPDVRRFGTLDYLPDGRLRGWREKIDATEPIPGTINAGIYIFPPATIGRFPDRLPLSMESDVFPALLAAGCRIDVAPVDAPFLDIGTPESLATAAEFIRRHEHHFERTTRAPRSSPPRRANLPGQT